MSDQFLYVEKYRPKTIDECILPESIKEQLTGFLRKKNLPNLLFKGSAGCGKTTAAKALAEQLGSDYIVINGSGEFNMETLRVRVTDFVTAVSLNGKKKIVIVDEADGLPVKTQEALRGFIEANHHNCQWIFTANFANKLITPLHSRCTTVDFRIEKADKPEMAKQFMKRACEILTEEGVEFDRKVIAHLITQHFPDYRRILNELQRFASTGKIDEGALVAKQESNVSDLILTIKDKDFKKMRQWVENNSDADFNLIYQKLFDELLDQINEVPQAVLILADYSYKEYFVVNKCLNLVACCVELMGTVTFK